MIQDRLDIALEVDGAGSEVADFDELGGALVAHLNRDRCPPGASRCDDSPIANCCDPRIVGGVTRHAGLVLNLPGLLPRDQQLLSLLVGVQRHSLWPDVQTISGPGESAAQQEGHQNGERPANGQGLLGVDEREGCLTAGGRNGGTDNTLVYLDRLSRGNLVGESV